MKKLITILLAVLCLTACGGKDDDKTITVIATPEPHSSILEQCKPLLAEKGYELEIIVVDDYYTPNKSLDMDEADANYFQHVPFFNGEVETNGYDIAIAAYIHIEPFGFYSKTIKDQNELKDGDRIIISNSVADHGRILAILDKAGILKLKEGADPQTATLDDVVENPLNLVFEQVNPEMLTSTYENEDNVALVAINGNYAIGAGLNPTKDAVILEQADETNPYVNIVACRTEDLNSDKINALVEVMKSDTIKNYITETYADGSVIPAH